MNLEQWLDHALGLFARQPAPPRVRFGPPRQTRINLQNQAGGRLMRRGQPIRPWHHSDPQWVERGWHRNGNAFQGYYHAAGRHWQGLIREPYPGGYEAYIWNPPLRELERRTGHRPCFQRPQSDGRYSIHFWEMPASLDHAVKSIEDVLKEAYQSRY
jgi:hypothetical protein